MATGTWKTGKRRPRNPLEIDFGGHHYRGWVGEIFKAIIRRAGAAGQRLPQGWEDQVWQIMQVKYPHYIQRIPGDVETMTISLSTVISFMQFLKRRGFDTSVVSTQEADRRAAICRACPKSGVIVGCSKCKDAVERVIKPPPHRLDFGQKYGKEVQGCTACGCYLAAKCWIPYRYLHPELPKHQWWDQCWMREDPAPEE